MTHTPGPCGCKVDAGYEIYHCQLHAAAPELLEALKDWREWMDDHPDTPYRQTPTVLCAGIDLAIAKATGQERGEA